MLNIMSFLLGVAFIGVVIFTTVTLFRGMIRGMRMRGALPYMPIPTLFPPIPVERTFGVFLIGGAAVLWSALHLALAGYWWQSGQLVPRIVASYCGAIYVSFAAVLTGVGGAMLLARRPFGRRLISWGLMLLGLLAFFGLIIALLLPKYEDAELWVRQMAMTIAAFMTGHIILDTAVGALGQRVGRPANFHYRQAHEIDQPRQVAGR